MESAGRFVWHELMTSDPKAAAKFYGAVVGWESAPAGNTTLDGHSYTVFNVPGYEMGLAGMMQLTPEMSSGGARPGWLGYIGVEDVDGKTRAFQENGGKILNGPQQVPGSWVVQALDPQSVMFSLTSAER